MRQRDLLAVSNTKIGCSGDQRVHAYSAYTLLIDNCQPIRRCLSMLANIWVNKLETYPCRLITTEQQWLRQMCPRVGKEERKGKVRQEKGKGKAVRPSDTQSASDLVTTLAEGALALTCEHSRASEKWDWECMSLFLRSLQRLAQKAKHVQSVFVVSHPLAWQYCCALGCLMGL